MVWRKIAIFCILAFFSLPSYSRIPKPSEWSDETRIADMQSFVANLALDEGRVYYRSHPDEFQFYVEKVASHDLYVPSEQKTIDYLAGELLKQGRLMLRTGNKDDLKMGLEVLSHDYAVVQFKANQSPMETLERFYNNESDPEVKSLVLETLHDKFIELSFLPETTKRSKTMQRILLYLRDNKDESPMVNETIEKLSKHMLIILDNYPEHSKKIFNILDSYNISREFLSGLSSEEQRRVNLHTREVFGLRGYDCKKLLKELGAYL